MKKQSIKTKRYKMYSTNFASDYQPKLNFVQNENKIIGYVVDDLFDSTY